MSNRSAALPLRILVASLFIPSAAQAADTVRFAVIVGNNQGAIGSRPLRFAEQDARKFHRAITRFGGVRARDAKLLIGKNAKQVWKALVQLEKRIKRYRAPGVRTLFVFYYSGHADGSVLELGQSSLSFEKLKRFFQSSQASVRLAFVDSCRSGQLVAMKGGRRGPAFRIRLADEIQSSGYAIITSSAADELSQESKELRGSFFTHYLVSALHGAADRSGDGRVTLREAYGYAYARTVARTSSTVGGGQHPSYDFKLSGRGDIVLTSRGTTELYVGSPFSARVLVLDEKRESVVAEGQVRSGDPLRLALAPGRYNVFLVGEKDVRHAAVTLKRHARVVVNKNDFSRQQLSRHVAKGGLFTLSSTHHTSANMLVRRLPLHSGVSMGFTLSHRIIWPSGWGAVARLGFAAAPEQGELTRFYELLAQLGVVKRWRLMPQLLVRTELLAGYEYLQEKVVQSSATDAGGFVYGGLLGVDVPFGALALTLDFGIGGRVFRIKDGPFDHALDVQGGIGLSWRWN